MKVAIEIKMHNIYIHLGLKVTEDKDRKILIKWKMPMNGLSSNHKHINFGFLVIQYDIHIFYV